MSCHSPSSPSPWHPRTHFLSVEEPVLGVSRNWTHTLGGPGCRASVTQHHVFEFPPRWGQKLPKDTHGSRKGLSGGPEDSRRKESSTHLTDSALAAGL